MFRYFLNASNGFVEERSEYDSLDNLYSAYVFLKTIGEPRQFHPNVQLQVQIYTDDFGLLSLPFFTEGEDFHTEEDRAWQEAQDYNRDVRLSQGW